MDPSTIGPMPEPKPREKLGGFEFYHKVLGSPKYIVAPMVDQSELAFRKLTRRYGAQLVYTPMINAKMFADPTHKYYREQYFDIASGEEGAFSLPTPSSSSSSSSSSTPPRTDTDRPLIVQFCANSPSTLLAAAKLVEAHCDAVDINLGCPQDIARRGRYGAFLMDDWDLIFSMINTLHTHLSVPVTAKFRVFPDIPRTVAYAQMLERAGAQILTCHGRTREQRGQNSGLASPAHIRAVKAAVRVPVFANGNVLFASDVPALLASTGADGVMSAEGVLYNPALFHSLALSPSPPISPQPQSQSHEKEPPPALDLTTTTHPPLAPLALEYLALVRAQRTRTAPSAVKGHLFKILRPALARPAYWDLRERLGRVRVAPPPRRGGKENTDGQGGAGGEGGEGEDRWEWVDEYVKICEEAKARLETDALTATATHNGSVPVPLASLITTDPGTELAVLPHWLAQPYFRGLKGVGGAGAGRGAGGGDGQQTPKSLSRVGEAEEAEAEAEEVEEVAGEAGETDGGRHGHRDPDKAAKRLLPVPAPGEEEKEAEAKRVRLLDAAEVEGEGAISVA